MDLIFICCHVFDPRSRKKIIQNKIDKTKSEISYFCSFGLMWEWSHEGECMTKKNVTKNKTDSVFFYWQREGKYAKRTNKFVSRRSGLVKCQNEVDNSRNYWSCEWPDEGK